MGTVVSELRLRQSGTSLAYLAEFLSEGSCSPEVRSVLPQHLHMHARSYPQLSPRPHPSARPSRPHAQRIYKPQWPDAGHSKGRALSQALGGRALTCKQWFSASTTNDSPPERTGMVRGWSEMLRGSGERETRLALVPGASWTLRPRACSVRAVPLRGSGPLIISGDDARTDDSGLPFSSDGPRLRGATATRQPRLRC